MADLSLENIQKIVEYHLRNTAKYKDDLESGWADSIVGSDGKTYVLKSNTKLLRDAIANIVRDTILDVLGGGTLSTGNAQGNPTRTETTPNKIKINGKLMSGMGDEIQIDGTSDPSLYVWIAVVSAFINAVAPGSCIPPTVINGKITGGG